MPRAAQANRVTAAKPRSPRGEAGADAGKAVGQTIATVERAADVLVHLAAQNQPTFGVTEIADALGMSKAAVHRILASLRTRGLIDLDEATRRYSLGVTAMNLGLAYLDRVDVRRIAHPELVALSEETSETATLSIRNGWVRFYVDQVTPRREVIMSVSLGVPYPLHAGASSKAFLAFLPDDELNAYLAQPELARLTSDTVTDKMKLRREIRQIHNRGYAGSFAERQSGAASVAAPVFDHTGRPAGVVSVCGPVERFRDEAGACAEALLQATLRLSQRMGYRPARP
jgi:IclR family transcriptional regulator, acetate operon repressor